MREAFNSPFWPFILATTSVGQEGLDFHLYCRDINGTGTFHGIPWIWSNGRVELTALMA